tara:strand:+ start:90 stop:941 length:852 start_codon:yes stop_codon:yes gene_type:complete
LNHNIAFKNFNKLVNSQGSKTLIMGIVNVTPDSFSDGGKFFTLKSAYDHSKKLIKDGADIIDIGGESSRPGSKPITLEEELERTIPLISKIRSNFPRTIISIDTTKSKVAEEAILSGANIINDISGLSFDKNMVKVASRYDVLLVIMHMQGKPETMQYAPNYNNLIEDIKSFFEERIRFATQFGIKKNRIILDPGLGFGKSYEDNFKLINQLKQFCDFELPVLIGPSRKSFIGIALNEEPESRLEGTLAAVSAGILRGAHIVRVHDVKQTKKVAKIIDLIRIA